MDGTLLIIGGIGIAATIGAGLTMRALNRRTESDVKYGSVEEAMAGVKRRPALSPFTDYEACQYPDCGCDFDEVCHATIPDGPPIREPGYDHGQDVTASAQELFPKSLQHYWVPNGELPGPDGKWWVFLGADRTIFGFTNREGAATMADNLNQREKRGKYRTDGAIMVEPVATTPTGYGENGPPMHQLTPDDCATINGGPIPLEAKGWKPSNYSYEGGRRHHVRPNRETERFDLYERDNFCHGYTRRSNALNAAYRLNAAIGAD